MSVPSSEGWRSVLIFSPESGLANELDPVLGRGTRSYDAVEDVREDGSPDPVLGPEGNRTSNPGPGVPSA